MGSGEYSIEYLKGSKNNSNGKNSDEFGAAY